jgi:hypothetical protein
LRELEDDLALLAAIAYYAERASRVNPASTSRRQLRRLLCEHDIRIAQLLERVKA